MSGGHRRGSEGSILPHPPFLNTLLSREGSEAVSLGMAKTLTSEALRLSGGIP